MQEWTKSEQSRSCKPFLQNVRFLTDKKHVPRGTIRWVTRTPLYERHTDSVHSVALVSLVTRYTPSQNIIKDLLMEDRRLKINKYWWCCVEECDDDTEDGDATILEQSS